MIRHVFLLILCNISVCVGIDLPQNGAGDGMSEQEQMAWLANGVYKFRTPLAGWTLVEKLQLRARCAQDTDNFAIYHWASAKRCVLAVAGTDSAADMFDNFDGRTVADCGFPDIHSGYMAEVNDLLKACGWHNRFLPFLTGDSCKNGISMVGHSLGGGVASVLASCANNPLRPYGFNVSKLWTFGAPAVSTPHPLHNPLSEDNCWEGGRVWNQDRIFIDPIPGLSRGLNFFHPRMKAIRIREKTTLGFGTGNFEEHDYPCGSYQGYEAPNTIDGTPLPSLHLMSAYCERTRKLYTGSFNAIQLSADATLAPADPIDCTIDVNYTYEEVVKYSSDRKDFSGWDISPSAYGTSYIVAFIVFVAGIYAGHRVRVLQGTKQILIDYYDQNFINDFIDEMKAELDENKDRIQLIKHDPLEWVKQFAAQLQESEKYKHHQETKTGGTSSDFAEIVKSPLLLAAKYCGCKSKRKSRRKKRSVAVEFFLYLVLSFPAFFFTALARTILDAYESSGEEMGRSWGDKNSLWMWPWTLGVIFYAPAMASALDVVLTVLAYPDWTVRAAHIVGVIGAAGELQMMWTENLSNTGKIGFVIGMMSSFIATLELTWLFIRRRIWPQTITSAGVTNLVAGLLLAAMCSVFIGCMFQIGTNCEFNPHNDECVLPEAFSKNAVMHLFFIAGALLICASMYFRMVNIDEEKVAPVDGDPEEQTKLS